MINFIYINLNINKLENFMTTLEKISKELPDFSGSNWLIRIPLVIVFLQQGLSKLPIDQASAEIYNLSLTLWFLVAWGEILSGFGLFLGGVLSTSRYLSWIGDLVTRCSGLTIVIIMIGVISTTKPDNLIDILLYDQFHSMLFLGGLFFFLRGNRVK